MLERIKSLFKRGGKVEEKEITDKPRYLKDIWQLDGVPAFYSFWLYGIWPWKYIYRGYYKLWHWMYEPTIADHNHHRNMRRMDAAKFVCSQLSRYIWGEQCNIAVTVKGGTGDNDPLGEFVDYVLAENNFYTKLGELEEQVLALGGGAIKQWCDVAKDDEGRPIPAAPDDELASAIMDTEGNVSGKAKAKLLMSYHMADQFVPTSWDNHDINEAIFVSREAVKGWYYSRLEWHKWDGETYVVSNDVYRNRVKDTPMAEDAGEGMYAEPQNILGWWYPLNQVYPLLSPMARIENLKRSLFVYIRAAGANRLDENSPIGMSVFEGALDTLYALDKAFDGFTNEIALARRRIIVPARAVEKYVDADTGKMHRWFNDQESVYEALNFDNIDDLKINDSTMDLRAEQYINAINGLLSQLCVQIGLDAGVLSFDKAGGMKTATEVVSENSKTYNTVQAHQNILRGALEKMVKNILDIAALYNMEFHGKALRPLVERGYEINVHFDDSIIQDTDAEINRGLLLVNSGILSKSYFMQNTLGMTKDEADAELKQVKAESTVDFSAVERFNDYSID